MKIDFEGKQADPDEMPHFVAFHLGLHCLQKYPFRGFQSAKGYVKVNWGHNWIQNREYKGQLMRFFYLSHMLKVIGINKKFERKIVNIFLPISLNISFGCSKEPSQ